MSSDLKSALSQHGHLSFLASMDDAALNDALTSLNDLLASEAAENACCRARVLALPEMWGNFAEQGGWNFVEA